MKVLVEEKYISRVLAKVHCLPICATCLQGILGLGQYLTNILA
jgi:hypothetical protein